MRKLICLLLCLLPLFSLAEEQPLYQGDGTTMLTITSAETLVHLEAGELPLRQGDRLIATGETVLHGEEVCYRVYLPGAGYGCVREADALLDEPQRLAYRPGFGVGTALFTVEDPEASRVEIVSLDNLEYPVVTLLRTYSQQQEDGSWRLSASFNTAPDVCKTTDESVCATLYGPDGEPVEVVTIAFFTTSWR